MPAREQVNPHGVQRSVLSKALKKRKQPAHHCKGCNRCFQGLTGAGVLLVTMGEDAGLKSNVDNANESKATKITPCVVLCRDYTGEYRDLGGAYSKKLKHISQTAEQECFEESRGLIKVKIVRENEEGKQQTRPLTPYVTIDSPFGRTHSVQCYRCYVVHLKSVDIAKYDAIDTSTLSSCFRETTKMVMFPVLALKMNWEKQQRKSLGDTHRTTDGSYVKIGNRTISVLLACLQAGII